MATSPTGTTARPPRQKHAWEVQARTRIDWLRAETREAALRRGGHLDDARGLVGGNAGFYAGAFIEIEERLSVAEDYLKDSAGPLDWIRGIRVEGAWANIHTAHARLIEAAGDVQALGLLPDVQSAVASYLPDNDHWRKVAAAWKGRDDGTLTDADRELLSNALRRAYDANAERYSQLRRYRNILLGAAVLFAALALTLSLVSARAPQVLPLCFPSTGNAATLACPTGTHRAPTGGDVAMVALLGMVGGAAGGLASLARATRATVTSYTLRVARTALKVTLGAITAIVGISFLRAGFVPGFSELKSQGDIIGYALVFGASQQLVTRIADQHGERVLKGASADADTGGA